jgi:hypothetical protein
MDGETAIRSRNIHQFDHPISRISELLPWTILSAVAEVST